MSWLAHHVNELGRSLQDRGSYRLAGAFYAIATRLAPGWGAPWFNRGLMAKFAKHWPMSLRYTLRSTELDPEFSPGWWNLGIAATALGEWTIARRAWWRYGIEVPLGEGPIEMDLGLVPIRAAPEEAAEVLWCRRIDPARAVIRSVPLPQCGRGHGDVLLHDGEPKGYRMLGEREVPVFDELGLLERSPYRTFEATVIAPDLEAAAELESRGGDNGIVVENWSNVR